jgi:hypothetical protein
MTVLVGYSPTPEGDAAGGTYRIGLTRASAVVVPVFRAAGS